MKRGRAALIFAVIILLLALALVYVNFFYKKSCKNSECFNSALYNCEKASYISDETDSIWFYTIKGKKAENCEVKVKLTQLKSGALEIKTLEGKEMSCYLPFRSVEKPTKNIENCHGILREEIQELMIKRLHNYILENVGKISEELKKVV